MRAAWGSFLLLAACSGEDAGAPRLVQSTSNDASAASPAKNDAGTSISAADAALVQDAAPTDPLGADASTPSDAAATLEASAPTDFFGASRCSSSAFALCDGFESAPVGAAPPAPWSVATQNAGDSVVIDDTRAARGTRSVHVHTGNTGFERALLYETSTFPAKGNAFFGRAFVYYASALPQAHWTHIAGVGNLPGTTTRTEVRYGGQFTHLMANYFGHDQYQHAATNVNGQWTDETKMPSARWACFEWQFDGPNDAIRFWLDEAEIPRLHVSRTSTDCCQNDPWTAPNYDRLQLGWEIYSNQDHAIASFDIWLDEIAVADERIGCTR